MNPSKEPLFEPLRDGLSRLRVDFYDLARTRWLLARLEATEAIRSLKGLAIVLAVATVFVLTGLPVLVVALADALDGTQGISRIGWLCSFGSGLLALGCVAGGAKYRRFRQEFVGLEETLEELREDVAWLREWSRRVEATDEAGE